MKVLHISKYHYPFIGGVEQVARDVVNAIKGNNVEQKIICFNHEKGTKKDIVDDVEVTRVGCIAKVSSQSISLSYGKELKKIIKNFNPDVVIFHYPNPFVAHYLLKYRKKYNFKLVLYWHLDITKQKVLGKFFHRQNKKLLDWTTKVIVTSPNYIVGSKYLSSYKDKCVVVPCCVNEDRLKYDDTHLNISKDIREKYIDKNICFGFGRHVEYKGLEYLIKASKLLDDKNVVLIGGKGPLTDSLKELAKDDPKVHFLGRISDDELKAYFLACDVFCFPSITKNEAFGIGLAEAMYYSKPAVTFNIPGSGVNYVSIDGLTGIEVENRNVEKYAAAISKLANDGVTREEMGQNGHNRVMSLFSQETFYSNVRKIISELTR